MSEVEKLVERLKEEAARNHRAATSSLLSEAARRVEELEGALKKIERWFGEFPETGRFWDNERTRPMSYAACYGSNGERDFMRSIARSALQSRDSDAPSAVTAPDAELGLGKEKS